jgi:hypothetical protein
MLVRENDTTVVLICNLCGALIQPDQPFIERGSLAIHSESADCDADEGRKPNIVFERSATRVRSSTAAR